MSAALGWLYVALLVAGVVGYLVARRAGATRAAAFEGLWLLVVCLGVSAATAFAENLLGPAQCGGSAARQAGGDVEVVGEPVGGAAPDLVASCRTAATGQVVVALAVAALGVVLLVRRLRRAVAGARS
ncbi:hypothetical protein, partial [Cellulomonas massiliensis]|uniref:hypothetical protein n=1 Tax=Cellulomonas massiliensis TaxID=1465811 RepID=UPI0004747B58